MLIIHTFKVFSRGRFTRMAGELEIKARRKSKIKSSYVNV